MGRVEFGHPVFADAHRRLPFLQWGCGVNDGVSYLEDRRVPSFLWGTRCYVGCTGRPSYPAVVRVHGVAPVSVGGDDPVRSVPVDGLDLDPIGKGLRRDALEEARDGSTPVPDRESRQVPLAQRIVPVLRPDGALLAVHGIIVEGKTNVLRAEAEVLDAHIPDTPGQPG